MRTRLLIACGVCFGMMSNAAEAQVGGVAIDPQGMLRDLTIADPEGKLDRLRADQLRDRTQNAEIAKASPLRKISLRRLEQVLREANGKGLPPEVRYLAGLTRIRYVLFDPDRKDVVLAGPAEGWQPLPSGDVIGATSKRPVLHLEDLAVAMRLACGDEVPSFLGVSIEPTAEGLKRHTAFSRSIGRMTRPQVPRIARGLQDAIGPQRVKFFGIPTDSRSAAVMLVADYRLKRMVMGHEPFPVPNLSGYLDLAAQTGVAPQSLHHQWWFEAKYDSILRSRDALSFALVGDEMVLATGPSTAKPSRTPSRFAVRYTEDVNRKLPQVVSKVPIFADLQNVIGLSVAAEIIARSVYEPEALSLAKSPGYEPTTLLDPNAFPLTSQTVPTHVPALASIRSSRNRGWLISVSGGVAVKPASLVDDLLKADPQATFPPLQMPNEKGNRWWWD